MNKLIQMTTKKEQVNEELIFRKEIENTPFTIITMKHESFGVMGRYRITEARETAKEVEKELKEITWNRIVQIIMLLTTTKIEEI